MVRSVQHEMLATPDHDETARQQFVVAVKQHLNRSLRPANRRAFDEQAAPAWEREHGRPPENRREIREAMLANRHYRTWSTLARSAQELMWDSLADTLARERPRLEATARRIMADPPRGGSLNLDPAFEVPRGMAKVEVHLQPGGYALDLGPDDVLAGAYYESGGNLYAFGQGIGRRDSKAAHVQGFLRDRYPDLELRRILDMGCSAGSATVPYALEFPEAEVHGIDVGGGMLRYAHARAEALGARVRFHQMDVAATHFPDGHFDLIVSHNMMHEVSDRTRRGAMRESFRLLRPGGVCIHQDVPLRFEGLDEFRKFDLSWDALYNNEPFWEVYATADLRSDLEAAGFPPGEVHTGHLPQRQGSLPWYVGTARKPVA